MGGEKKLFLEKLQKTAENAGAQGENGEQAQNSKGLIGSIHTDPDSGESYHIAPDGTVTPMSEMENPAAEEPQTAAANKDYSAVITAPDYAEKSKAAMDGRSDELYNYINNIGDTRERMYNQLGAENNWYGIYENMSPDEVRTYNYLSATQGKSEAEKYLRSLGNTLNQRLGNQISDSLKGNTAMEVMYGVGTGFDRRFAKAARAIPGNEGYISPHEYAREQVRADLGDGSNEGRTPLQFGFDVADRVGYNLF